MPFYNVRITYDEALNFIKADNEQDATRIAREWVIDNTQFYNKLDYKVSEIKEEKEQC